jgi:hypothetical protein
MQESTEDSTWTYLTKNATGLYTDGLVELQSGGNLVPITFPSTILTFPSTMGTSYNTTWNGDILNMAFGIDIDGPGPTAIIDSAKISRVSTLSSTIDAWGDVTTPFGTFASIRQMVENQTIDTVWTSSGGSGIWEIIAPTTATFLGLDQVTYDTTRTVRWWTDDSSSKFPLVEMDYEANGTVTSVDWQKSSIDIAVAVAEQEIAGSNFSLYPNPAKNEITIETGLTNNTSIKVLDVTGKLIIEKRLNTSKITLSVSALKNGIYFYTILGNNGNIVHSNKFIVAK